MGQEYRGNVETKGSNERPERHSGALKPVVALEILSAGTVNCLLLFVWSMIISIVIVAVVDIGDDDDRDMASLIMAWIFGLLLVVTVAVGLWVHLEDKGWKNTIRYLFYRDWGRIEVAAPSLVMLLTVIYVPSCIITITAVTIRVLEKRNLDWAFAIPAGQDFCGFLIYLIGMGGFSPERLTVLWWLPRVVSVLASTSLTICLLYVVTFTEPLDVEMRNRFWYAQFGVQTAIVLWGIIDFARSKWKLDQAPYIETRFRQICFRFISAVWGILIIVFYIVGHILRAGIYFYRPPDDIVVALEMFGSTMIVCAWVVIIIAFLPPRRENCLLGKKLKDQNTFLVPWADVSLACAVSHDCYYDHPDDVPSQSGSGPLSWTRKGFRVLGWVRNDDTDAHCLVAEITSDAHSVLKGYQDDWKLHEGDLVVAFRGTGSITNAITDLTICRSTVPMDLLASGHDGRHQHREYGYGDDVEDDREEDEEEEGAGETGGFDCKRKSEKGTLEMTTTEEISLNVTFAGTKAVDTTGDEAKGQSFRANKEVCERGLESRKSRPSFYGTSTSVRISAEKKPKESLKDLRKMTMKRQESFWREAQKSSTDAGAGARIAHWIMAGTVHSGFLAYYMSIREQLIETLDNLLTPQEYANETAATQNNMPAHRQLRKPEHFKPVELRSVEYIAGRTGCTRCD